MVFYLKLNRCVDYSLRNLQVWINTISLYEEATVYLLCDNESLNDRIRKEISFKDINYTFLYSIKRDEDEELMKSIAVPRWYNAGYAHLTPFIHSKEKEYTDFWNIDADDTLFCLPPDRIYDALREAEEYAKSKGVDLFSLDMWRSRSNSMHWSFGITYTNAEVDWIDIMKRNSGYSEGSIYFSGWNHPKNIDEFFTYIKEKDKTVKIGTFYIDNLLFMHYSDDFVMNPISSGVFKWRKGRLVFPIIENVYGIKSLGNIKIAEDVIKLDVGIDDFDGSWSLAQMAPFNMEVQNIIEAEEYVERRTTLTHKQINNNINKYLSMIEMASNIYIFGFGKFTDYLINALQEQSIYPRAILDNAESKWGNFIDGLNVCNPEIIKESDYNNTVILIDVRYVTEIKKQLLEYGVHKNNIITVIDYT